tara:strand:+ start:12193 stop:12459 length:267 start_codon:yes stop_codon:yes gene_type:complete
MNITAIKRTSVLYCSHLDLNRHFLLVAVPTHNCGIIAVTKPGYCSIAVTAAHSRFFVFIFLRFCLFIRIYKGLKMEALVYSYELCIKN